MAFTGHIHGLRKADFIFMNRFVQELNWLENEANEVQVRYPNAKTLPAYLDTLSRLAEAVRAEQKRTEEFIASIPDLRVREIAVYRLLEGLTFEEIADITQYSSSHIQRLWRPYREQYHEKHK